MLPPREKLKCATLNFLFYVGPKKFAAPGQFPPLATYNLSLKNQFLTIKMYKVGHFKHSAVIKY